MVTVYRWCLKYFTHVHISFGSVLSQIYQCTVLVCLERLHLCSLHRKLNTNLFLSRRITLCPLGVMLLRQPAFFDTVNILFCLSLGEVAVWKSNRGTSSRWQVDLATKCTSCYCKPLPPPRKPITTKFPNLRLELNRSLAVQLSPAIHGVCITIHVQGHYQVISQRFPPQKTDVAQPNNFLPDLNSVDIRTANPVDVDYSRDKIYNLFLKYAENGELFITNSLNSTIPRASHVQPTCKPWYDNDSNIKRRLYHRSEIYFRKTNLPQLRKKLLL